MAVLLTKYAHLDRGMTRAMDERHSSPGGLSPATLFDVIKYGHHAAAPRGTFNDGDIDGGDVVRAMARMAGGQTAIQSNAQPMGGVTAMQPVPPAGEMTPSDIATLVEQLTPAATRFRKQSTLMKVKLETKNYTQQGDDQIARFANVGLGYLVISHHHLVITLKNAGTAAEIVKFSPWFPYTLLNSSQIAINGGAATYSCNALGGILVAARVKQGMLWLNTRAGRGEAIDPALVLMSADSNGTFTSVAAGTFPAQLCGATQLSIAGSSSSVLTVDFVTFEKVVADFDSGIGALPLQNNSTYATLERILQSAFVTTSTTDQRFSFYNAGADVTVTAVSGFSEALYEFASVPPDQTLYNDMVVNSYQVQQQRSVAAGGTGVQAWVYNVPQNLFLVAAHTVFRDGNNQSIDARPVTANFPNYQLVYNGNSIQPVLQTPWPQGGLDFLNYKDSRSCGEVGGYLKWDGEDTSNSPTSTDEMNWIDTYNAATPQITSDLATTLTTTVTADVTREAIVSGSVQVVGG